MYLFFNYINVFKRDPFISECKSCIDQIIRVLYSFPFKIKSSRLCALFEFIRSDFTFWYTMENVKILSLDKVWVYGSNISLRCCSLNLKSQMFNWLFDLFVVIWECNIHGDCKTAGQANKELGRIILSFYSLVK